MLIGLALLTITLSILTLIALGLHRISHRYGLIPLLVYISGLLVILYSSNLYLLFIEVSPGITLRLSSDAFVPVILLVTLVLYITNGTQPTQLLLYGLVSVTVLMLFVFFVPYFVITTLSDNLALTGTLIDINLITPHLFRIVTVSASTFAVDMLVIMVVYQGMQNRFPRIPDWIRIGAALLGALWTDSILFMTLANLGTPDFARLLPGDVLVKTWMALVLWLPTAYYLIRIAPELPGYTGTAHRPTFDILVGTFGQLAHALERSRTELQENRLLYQQLVTHIDEIFWMIDFRGKPSYFVSPTFERMTGYSRAEFYKNPGLVRAMLHPHERDRLPDNFIRYLLETPEDEMRIIRADGKLRWIRNRVFFIRNTRDRIYRIAGFAIDITDQRAAIENEIQVILHQEKVNLLRDFISEASHDLKTPLSSIQLQLDMLRRRSDDAAARAYHLSQMETRIHELNGLIDDMFTLSRLENLDRLEFEPLNISELVSAVCGSLSAQFASKNLELVQVIEPAIQVTGDQDELNRVFLNLIGNAFRYTAAGSVTVRLENQSDMVIVTIHDTGIGIGADDVPRLFERFFRAESATTAEIDGTGLGLAIVKRVVDMHNGQIEVESEIGKGTLFRVALPCEPPHVEDKN
jgi:PAS domain S-box-containing protein